MEVLHQALAEQRREIFAKVNLAHLGNQDSSLGRKIMIKQTQELCPPKVIPGLLVQPLVVPVRVEHGQSGRVHVVSSQQNALQGGDEWILVATDTVAGAEAPDTTRIVQRRVALTQIDSVGVDGRVHSRHGRPAVRCHLHQHLPADIGAQQLRVVENIATIKIRQIDDLRGAVHLITWSQAARVARHRSDRVQTLLVEHNCHLVRREVDNRQALGMRNWWLILHKLLHLEHLRRTGARSAGDHATTIDGQAQELWRTEGVVHQQLTPLRVHRRQLWIVEIEVGHHQLRHQPRRGQRVIVDAHSNLADAIVVVGRQQTSIAMELRAKIGVVQIVALAIETSVQLVRVARRLQRDWRLGLAELGLLPRIRRDSFVRQRQRNGLAIQTFSIVIVECVWLVWLI